MAKLLGRMAKGEDKALVELYQRAAPIVYATCLRILHDVEEANDVTSETFWRLWTRAHRFDPAQSSALAWILIVTRRQALDRRRSRLRRRRTLDRFQQLRDAPKTEEDDVVARRRLVAALRLLSASDRALLEAAYFEGLSGADIAARERVPLGTVKSRLRAALARLRAAFVRGAS
jgi:RNA polymerase sigma-70 factor (ECF subfamily)